MKKKILIMGIIMVVIPILGTQGMSNNLNENSQTMFKTADNIDYYIENYLVYLDVKGSNIDVQINITYNVLSGIKTDGFKRFVKPGFYGGYIEENSIKIYDDDNLILMKSYRVFTRDDHEYMEISFKHPGFRGLKTISINFTLMDWIIENIGQTHIELTNIGKLEVNVVKAKYIILFPEDYTPETIKYSESGFYKQTVSNGRHKFVFMQNDPISSDITIICIPNLTDAFPWENLYQFIILGVVCGLTVIGILKGKGSGRGFC